MICASSFLMRQCHSSSNHKKSRNNTQQSTSNRRHGRGKGHREELKPILFTIYDYDIDHSIIKHIRGYTNQQIDKPTVVNENVIYGRFVLEEEKQKIHKIIKKYHYIYDIGTNEKRMAEIDAIKKETNWKLRILNDLEKEMNA